MLPRQLLLAILLLPLFTWGQISNYKRILANTEINGQQMLLLRSFKKKDTSFYIAVDLKTMTTAVVLAKGLKVNPSNWTTLKSSIPNSPYIKALKDAKQQDLNLQDAGITHGYPAEKGITLTIDLCPSHRPLDRDLFNSLISALKNNEAPVPVALSLSGKFLLKHPTDIDWLLDKVEKKELSITWINHSYHHYYEPGLPLQENFMLKPETNLDIEVLGNEKAMLEHGIIPSIFFRFPGLVSNPNLVDSIINYGLIPIGSDAWLAKGQQASKGSIVLIHGNGNEPLGIADFLQLLRSDQQAISQRQWLLFDLRTSIADQELH